MLLDLEFPTSYSRMTAWFFVERLYINVFRYNLCFMCMKQAFGQSLNRGKINIFFSSNTLPRTREAIATFLGIPINQPYKQYLCLPSLMGHNKKKSFSLIKDRIWKKLKGWKEKLLSLASHEILIKVVIQAIPTYIMLCFKLPKGLISEFETLIRKVWWGYRSDQRKIYWVSWAKLCFLKNEGNGFSRVG